MLLNFLADWWWVFLAAGAVVATAPWIADRIRQFRGATRTENERVIGLIDAIHEQEPDPELDTAQLTFPPARVGRHRKPEQVTAHVRLPVAAWAGGSGGFLLVRPVPGYRVGVA